MSCHLILISCIFVSSIYININIQNGLEERHRDPNISKLCGIWISIRQNLFARHC